jgi:hypothetical protein
MNRVRATHRSPPAAQPLVDQVVGPSGHLPELGRGCGDGIGLGIGTGIGIGTGRGMRHLSEERCGVVREVWRRARNHKNAAARRNRFAELSTPRMPCVRPSTPSSAPGLLQKGALGFFRPSLPGSLATCGLKVKLDGWRHAISHSGRGRTGVGTRSRDGRRVAHRGASAEPADAGAVHGTDGGALAAQAGERVGRLGGGCTTP